MRDLKKEFTIPNGVNSLNATASLDPFYGPFESVDEAYDLVPEAKRAVGKIFAIYLDSTKSNIDLYYWITNGAGAEWRAIPLVPNIDTDRVISLGAITVNGSVVTIGLHSGGSNSVQINNAIYSRYESISFTTDAIISAGNFRKDIIEARADSTVFYLKKGVESTNPVPPAVTEGALFISEVLVTSTGVSAGALNSVVTDSTMKGDGTSQNPLGLSDTKNAEIAGKIGKQGIDLGNTADVPNMKIGNHNGIYRAYGASNPIQEFAPFMQMSVGDTYAQISVDQYSGALSYRAGFQNNPYSATRTAWDTGNLVNPATQTWVNQQHYLQADSAVYAGFVAGYKERPYIRHSDMTVVELATSTGVNQQVATKQDKSMFSALVDKMVHYYDLATQKMLSTGVEFISAGILKLKSIILTTNTGTALANELGFDGTNVVFGASKKKLAFKDEIFEHNVRGKVLTATGVNGTYNCDLNAYTRWHLTLTGNTTIAFTNMILEDETITGGFSITGSFAVTFPSWLSKSPGSFDYDGSKVNRITFEITKGGSSPLGRYSIEVYNA